MSSLSATTSGLPDLLQQGSPSTRQGTSLPSRAGESFWQGVFDRAETLGLATTDAGMQAERQGAQGQSGPRNTLHAAPVDARPSRGQADGGAAAAQPGETAPAVAPWTSAEGRQVLTSTPWAPSLASTQAARWQAGQCYGLGRSERRGPGCGCQDLT
ncbi:MAG: hypothetical protein EOP36_19930, partial [Rubrivivax sp.]